MKRPISVGSVKPRRIGRMKRVRKTLPKGWTSVPRPGLKRVGEDYLMIVPDEWIVRNPLWKEFFPEEVEKARLRLLTAKPTKEST